MLSAAYDSGEPALWLVFDRAVNIAAINTAAFILEDAQFNNFRYDGGGGAELTGPETLKVLLVEVDNASGSGVKLSVAAGNGVVAVDDGGTWAGVSDLALPFPP